MREARLTAEDYAKSEQLARDMYGLDFRDLDHRQQERVMVQMVGTGTRPWKASELRSLDYRTGYLRSGWWKLRRKVALLRAACRCQHCEKRGRDVHHTSYANLGNEFDGDLLVLCRSCHEAEHKRMERSPA